jgi:hypothetical protein
VNQGKDANQGKDLLKKVDRDAIARAITNSESAWIKFLNDNKYEPGGFLAMKYVPSMWAKGYRRTPNNGFFIGNKNFTWGKAVYVTGVAEPLSTATYGRVGIVSWFEPDPGWRVFDARDPKKARLYLKWLNAQPTYPEAVLTVHTDHWLHGLRNDFREQFAIDVILCHPDEFDSEAWYTNPKDTWLCVSDWRMGPAQAPRQRYLADFDYSERFPEVRLAVVPEEEFVIPGEPTKVRPPNKPLTRDPQLAISGAGPLAYHPKAYWHREIVQAYQKHEIVRIPS